jgi:hypothetical protein
MIFSCIVNSSNSSSSLRSIIRVADDTLRTAMVAWPAYQTAWQTDGRTDGCIGADIHSSICIERMGPRTDSSICTSVGIGTLARSNNCRRTAEGECQGNTKRVVEHMWGGTRLRRWGLGELAMGGWRRFNLLAAGPEGRKNLVYSRASKREHLWMYIMYKRVDWWVVVWCELFKSEDAF